jgi:hypothetical protein
MGYSGLQMDGMSLLAGKLDLLSERVGLLSDIQILLSIRRFPHPLKSTFLEWNVF